MRFAILAAAASLTVLGACSSHSNDQATDTNVMMANDSLMANDMAAGTDDMNATMDNGAAAMPTDAAGFIKTAGASDLYEIQSSKLALQASNDQDVKDFAQMMITDHTKTTQAVKDAAAKANLTVSPPQLTPEQQQNMDTLQPLTGDAFDTAYVQQQLPAHQQALALMQNYAESGDTPALQDAAKSAIPIIQKHISELQKLSKQGG
jgi:putative membrane protein